MCKPNTRTAPWEIPLLPMGWDRATLIAAGPPGSPQPTHGLLDSQVQSRTAGLEQQLPPKNWRAPRGSPVTG